MKHVLPRLVCLGLGLVVLGCGRASSSSSASPRSQGDGAPPYTLSLAEVSGKDAIAAGSLGVMFCVDVSPSMNDRVGSERKIDASKAAMKTVLDQLEAWAKANPNKKLKVGLIAFSGRADVVRPLALFDKPALEKAIQNLQLGNATAIGDAMILGSQELLRAGVENKALIVLTDGENNRGIRPDWVMGALSKNHNNLAMPTDDVKVFLLAFDIQASKFNEVKNAGAAVLESKDKPALDKILKEAVDEVLLEKPR
jgi:Mg-chelatase subunit ChlD